MNRHLHTRALEPPAYVRELGTQVDTHRFESPRRLGTALSGHIFRLSFLHMRYGLTLICKSVATIYFFNEAMQ